MPRPNKIREPVVTFNLLIPKRHLVSLRRTAHEMSLLLNEQVSVADLIREAVALSLCEKASGPDLAATNLAGHVQGSGI